MKSLNIFVVGVSAFVTVFAVQAQDTKFFKELDVNMTFEEMNVAVNRNPATCADPVGKCFIVYHTEKYSTIADVPIRFLNFSYNQDNLFNNMLITFGSEKYDEVKNALSTKYKFSCKQESVQNLMGAQFPQEKCTSLNKNFSVSLFRYTHKIDESGVSFLSNAGLKNQIKKDVKKSIKAAGDV